MIRRIMILVAAVLMAACGTEAPTASARSSVEFQQAVDLFADENGQPRVTWVNLPPSMGVISACGPIAPMQALAYCKYDQTAYIGETANDWIADDTHWLAPGFAAAHEWGHHIWYMDGESLGGQAAEDYGDCVGGAWIGWYNKYAALGLSPIDLWGFSDLMNKIKRVEHGDIHGTYLERGGAALIGFTGGLGACNHYKLFA